MKEKVKCRENSDKEEDKLIGINKERCKMLKRKVRNKEEISRESNEMKLFCKLERLVARLQR
jgi:hypothetical protein